MTGLRGRPGQHPTGAVGVEDQDLDRSLVLPADGGPDPATAVDGTTAGNRIVEGRCFDQRPAGLDVDAEVRIIRIPATPWPAAQLSAVEGDENDVVAVEHRQAGPAEGSVVDGDRARRTALAGDRGSGDGGRGGCRGHRRIAIVSRPGDGRHEHGQHQHQSAAHRQANPLIPRLCVHLHKEATSRPVVSRSRPVFSAVARAEHRFRLPGDRRPDEARPILQERPQASD
jgi:hypothetical protein